MIYAVLILAALLISPSKGATFQERWPDPFHEFEVLPYPAPFQSDEPQLRTYALDSNGWIVGRCGILFHRTLCLWDEASI